MYNYRKLNPAQKKELLAHRHSRHLPLHAPPHFSDGHQTYLITTSCFEHRAIIDPEPRRLAFQESFLAEFPAQLQAWVILPNHYHLLIITDLQKFRERIRILHSSYATKWNREDQTKGRQIWYRFQDRIIRSEAHYFASVNYLHSNPVKHNCVAKATDWPCSSLSRFMTEQGRDAMLKLWRDYPIGQYGAGWDDNPERHSV